MYRIIVLLYLSVVFSPMSYSQYQPVGSAVFHWNDLPVKKDGLREGRKILEGTTQELGYFGIHATTQQKGATPRPPHAQEDLEELIIIKEGTLTCTIGERTVTLGAGSVLMIPPHVSQAFENKGDGPVTYYVLMYRSTKPADPDRCRNAGGTILINADTLVYTEKNDKGTRKYFDRPTAMCENYEMHTTTLLKKGPSHAPHQHPDTEIILVVSGEVGMTIDGQYYQGGAGDLFIAESGKLHGVSNATDSPCTYFAFKWR